MFEDVAGLPPFRRAEAPPWLSEARIRRALRSGDLVCERRGVLVGRRRVALASGTAAHVLETQVAITGLRGGSTAYACLGSAAVLHRLARLGRPPQRVRLYRERGGPWRDDRIAVLVCSLPRAHVTCLQGVPTTTCARTAVDLARWVTFRSAVVVMDSALRNGCGIEEIDAVVGDCTRWPGIRHARKAALFADGRAESPLESISRVVMHEAGLPAPALQVPLGIDEMGVPTGVVDFYWDDYRLIGEADGLLKYDEEPAADGESTLRAEKLRQEALEALDYRVVRWTWNDIWYRPDWVMERLRRAMTPRGVRPRRA